MFDTGIVGGTELYKMGVMYEINNRRKQICFVRGIKNTRLIKY